MRALYCGLAATMLLVAGVGLAQEGEGEEQETRQVSGINAKTYEKFAKAQELAEAENYQGAINILNEIKNGKKKPSPAEMAQLYNFYGFIYYSQDRYTDAIKAYETVLQQPELDEGTKTNTLYTIAQLYFSMENWQQAINKLNEWLKIATNPAPEPYILIGTAYYQLEQYNRMIQPVEKAMSIARERGKPIKEQWWLLLRVAYYEGNNLSKVADILEVLVVNWPKKEYWTMLSAMYSELNKERQQLSAYASAYDQGMLVKSSEVVQMSQLYMQADAPFKAAKVLDKGITDGIVDKTAENYRLLSQAWQMAAEYDKAITPLKKAAAISNQGELDVRLANSYLNLGRHDECVSAARDGIRKGGLKRRDTAYELLGTCLYEKSQYEDAKNAFRQAAKDKRAEKRALNWVKFISSEQQRLEQLNKSIRELEQARSQPRDAA